MSCNTGKSRLFLISQGITLFGSSVVQFAIIWYVTMQTSSGVWVSAMTVSAYLPQFIISFFAGVWADRYSRKFLIILADSVIAAATLLLAIILPHISSGVPILLSLVTISAVRSVATGVQTPAVNAVIPQLVPEDKLMKFNGINSTVQSLVQFAAPAAAGAVLSFGTLRAALLIDIITAFVGISILTAVAIPHTRVDAAPSMLSEMKAGFKYAAGNRIIGRILLIFGFFIFLCVPSGFMATLFVNRYYGQEYLYMTLVEVVGFCGMAGGGLLIGIWGGFKNRITTLILGITAYGIIAVFMGAVNSLVFYLILMGVCGVALTMVQTASTTLLQEKSSPEMLGRIFGLFSTIFSGFLPLGMLVFGPVADVVSMRFLMIVSGTLLIVMATFVFLIQQLHKKNQYDTSVPD